MDDDGSRRLSVWKFHWNVIAAVDVILLQRPVRNLPKERYQLKLDNHWVSTFHCKVSFEMASCSCDLCAVDVTSKLYYN